MLTAGLEIMLSIILPFLKTLFVRAAIRNCHCLIRTMPDATHRWIGDMKLGIYSKQS